MLRQKRRPVELFSLSFMDCICCGFGAVLLLFILTTGQKVNFSQQDLEELQSRVRQMEKQITVEQTELDRMAKSATVTAADLQSLVEQASADQVKATEQKEDLALLLRQIAAMRDERDRLLAEQKNLPKEEVQPIPIPEVDRRQYLTGVKFEGDYVLLLVRNSGSMLGDSLEEAISRLGDPDFKKREAPKWQRTIKAVEWTIANLAPETSFQIFLFNDETVPLLPARSGEWVSRKDRVGVQEIITRLRLVVPQGSANLERAFSAVRYMSRLPDAVVLFTDGLPTTSDTSPNDGPTDDELRIRYFRYAQRQLPQRIPVSTILFPMTGDPGAAALYWDLASSTRGALVSPSSSWPDT